LIELHSIKRGDFTLSSGGKSTYLFQLRQTTMLPEGAKILGDVIVDFMRHHGLRCVGGLAVGAIPMVSAVSVMSFIKEYPVDAFFVRKEAKAHGALERIDGFVSEGEEALLIDDVATSGNSIIKSMEGMYMEHPSSIARKALVVIDREEGARANLARHGIELYSIFTRRDFNI
jgi:orotate phosphoribosyltransferase